MSERDRVPSGLAGWRGALVCVAAGLALVGAVEVGLQAEWRARRRSTSYSQHEYPNGRVAHVREREERWLGGVLELWLRPDGTVDRERSHRARYGLRRALEEEEIAEIETNDWWGEVDAGRLAFAIGWHVRKHGSLPVRVEELAPPRTPFPPDRWGRAYVYTPPEDGVPARITSFGKDGAPGGTGDDADWSGELDASGDARFSSRISKLSP